MSDPYNYEANPGYPGTPTLQPQRLEATTTTSYARLTNTATPAQKALIYNAGAGDVSLSTDGVNLDRTIPSGTEYEWSNPDGVLQFDLSEIYVKSASAGYSVKVLYR